jgi:5'(3')-deoxyribonucleotidase
MDDSPTEQYVLGLDLDGTCADFYGRMREIAAEWTGQSFKDLENVDPVWGLTSWGIPEGQYDRFHRFAVTQRALFETLAPVKDAPQVLRRLSADKIRIRVITHRLFIPYFHQTAVEQTVSWLDDHDIPYWDLCFMAEKGAVGANLYIDDSPENVTALRGLGHDVILFDNPTNRDVADAPGGRAKDWAEAEAMIREHYRAWLEERARS